MHTVQLLLKTSKYERHEIDRRFHALAHLHNVCAVSYTHLDVYKRQAIDSGADEVSFFFFFLITE